MDARSSKEIKREFLEDNPKLTEVDPSENVTIDEFCDINEDEDEIWLLQCPKGMNISEFQNQKLKFPGRIKIKEFEAVAMDSPNAKKATFGYCNRKKKYSIKDLHIAGTIILREQLAGAEAITAEKFKEACPSAGPVPMPELKIRHPLWGSKFDKFLKIDKDISERLQNSHRTMSSAESIVKKESRKRKHDTTVTNGKKVKPIKSEKQENIEISEDLQWLKQI